MAGGKQDQYAATFGGFNYMEFFRDDKVIVNPLRIDEAYVNELESRLLLFYTSQSRLSASIIEEQQRNVQSNNRSSIEAMHVIKQQAAEMKEAMLTGRIDRIGHLLHEGFVYKKKMAEGISNSWIDEIYEAAMEAGAEGGKVLGAGGGGFMMFFCPDARRGQVYNALFLAAGEGLERLTPDRAISLAELGAELKNQNFPKIVVGDGAALCYNGLREQIPDLALAPEHLRWQSAWGVARAARELAARGELVKGGLLVPVYHRLSQAERERLARERNETNGRGIQDV